MRKLKTLQELKKDLEIGAKQLNEAQITLGKVWTDLNRVIKEKKQ